MVVMAALADLAERVEVTYTDLSPQLVAYGQKTYGKQYPFVVFKQLDVEKSIQCLSYDTSTSQLVVHDHFCMSPA